MLGPSLGPRCSLANGKILAMRYDKTIVPRSNNSTPNLKKLFRGLPGGDDDPVPPFFHPLQNQLECITLPNQGPFQFRGPHKSPRSAIAATFDTVRPSLRLRPSVASVPPPLSEMGYFEREGEFR